MFLKGHKTKWAESFSKKWTVPKIKEKGLSSSGFKERTSCSSLTNATENIISENPQHPSNMLLNFISKKWIFTLNISKWCAVSCQFVQPLWWLYYYQWLFSEKGSKAPSGIPEICESAFTPRHWKQGGRAENTENHFNSVLGSFKDSSINFETQFYSC